MNSDWTFLTLAFNSRDRTAVEVSARLGHHGSTCTGKAWFDDLCLIEVDDALQAATEHPSESAEIHEFVGLVYLRTSMQISPSNSMVRPVPETM